MPLIMASAVRTGRKRRKSRFQRRRSDIDAFRQASALAVAILVHITRQLTLGPTTSFHSSTASRGRLHGGAETGL
jgi:hypothetical protein